MIKKEIKLSVSPLYGTETIEITAKGGDFVVMQGRDYSYTVNGRELADALRFAVDNAGEKKEEVK